MLKVIYQFLPHHAVGVSRSSLRAVSLICRMSIPVAAVCLFITIPCAQAHVSGADTYSPGSFDVKSPYTAGIDEISPYTAGIDINSSYTADGDVAANGFNPAGLASSKELHPAFSEVVKEYILTAPDGNEWDHYGSTVAIDGDYAVVGAYSFNGESPSEGAAFIYRFNGADWLLEQKIASPVPTHGYAFGRSVAISGDRIIIGAVAGASLGAVYVYVRNGTNWVQEAVLTASDAAPFRSFGFRVAIQGSRVIIGAHGSGRDRDETGRAYIFAFDGTGWREEAILIPSDGEAGDFFGASVAIYGSHVIVGAHYHDQGITNTGAVYTYLLEDGAWVEKSKLINSDNAGFELFGYRVSLSGNRALISSPGHKGTIHNGGAAYIFEWNGDEWIEKAKLETSNPQEDDQFGMSASLSGDMAVIGSRNFDNHKGAAYSFYYDGANWNEQMKLSASDGVDGDLFGSVVSLSGNRTIIGAYNKFRNFTGGAYIYELPLQDSRDIVVNSIADRSGAGDNRNCDTGEIVEIDGEEVPECTLRAAIETLNSRARADSISFNIDGAGPHTITPASPLPVAEHPMVLDATTQPGYNGLPLIVLNGMDAIQNGLVLDQGGSVIRGFSIGGFTHAGVFISGPGDNLLEANHIGVNASGTAAFPNTTGILIDGSAGNRIGGPEPGQMNIISGNTDTRDGVKMSEERTGSGILIQGGESTGNIIQGNRIGTDYSGQSALGNGYVGVLIYDAPENRIGGDEESHGNVISANADNNVLILGPNANENIVSGNLIGTNADGTASLSENSGGLGIAFGSRNRIGGSTSTPGMAPGNLISGNGQAGVVLAGINPDAIEDATGDVMAGIASGNIIAGNLIGTNRDGSSALPNQMGIVAIYDAHKTQIGGDQAGYRNVISGNELGIILADSAGGLAPHETVIAGNYIGTTINGNEPLGNQGPGIMLSTLSPFPDESTGIAGVRIGGISPASRNVVAGNAEKQIEVTGPMSAGTVIMNNYIGVLANGQPSQNPDISKYGIYVRSNEILIGSDHEENTGANVIGGNEYGVFLGGNTNLVAENRIGTNPGGTVAVPNQTGVWVLGNGNILIGNTISGNTDYGVQVGQKPDSDDFEGVFFDPEMTALIKNNIGTNAQARNALGNGLGSDGAGVVFWRGKSLQMYLNVLSGNHHGVHIANSYAESGTRMAGNFIGGGGMIPNEIEDVLALPEFVSIPNQSDGVRITDGRVYLNNKPEIELLEELELGNFIQNNRGAGVRRTGSNLTADLEITSNFFFGNTGMGIDIGPVGPGTGGSFHEPPVLMQPVFVQEHARLRGVSGVS